MAAPLPNPGDGNVALPALVARAGAADFPWESLRPGVDIHRLCGDGSGAAVALLRYAPGARIPRHKHAGYERIHVLSGAQQDERGVYRAGARVVNAPGSEHAVSSPDGCLVLIVWESPVVFLDDGG